MYDRLLDLDLQVRLAAALAHFLWQGLLIALLAAATGLALRKAAARVRYGVYVVALQLMAACPVATFWILAPEEEVPAAPVVALEPAPTEEAFSDYPFELETEARVAAPIGMPRFEIDRAPTEVEGPIALERAVEPIVETSGGEGFDWRQLAPWATAASTGCRCRIGSWTACAGSTHA